MASMVLRASRGEVETAEIAENAFRQADCSDAGIPGNSFSTIELDRRCGVLYA